MVNPIKLEFIAVGVAIIILLIVGGIWYNTKNKRIEKFLRKIKDFIESLLTHI